MCCEHWPGVDLGIKHHNIALFPSFLGSMISTLHYSGQSPRGNETFCCHILALLEDNKSGLSGSTDQEIELMLTHCQCTERNTDV